MKIASERDGRFGKAPTITALCRRMGMSRQNYYAARRRAERAEAEQEEVLKLTDEVRRLHPRMGGRKTLFMIKQRLCEKGIKIGRDRYFDLLRRNDRLIRRKKARKPRTTKPSRSLPVFHNIAGDVKTTGPNQVWVADMSYVSTAEGFMYMSLIMDRHTRMVVGAHIGDTLESEGCLAALEQALEGLPDGCAPIHHSDRGCQYTSRNYVERLQRAGLKISVTEVLHCYENAHAERVIGILKDEYAMDSVFGTKKDAARCFYQSLYLYNCSRPHGSLEYKRPVELHYGESMRKGGFGGSRSWYEQWRRRASDEHHSGPFSARRLGLRSERYFREFPGQAREFEQRATVASRRKSRKSDRT